MVQDSYWPEYSPVVNYLRGYSLVVPSRAPKPKTCPPMEKVRRRKARKQAAVSKRRNR